MTNVIEVKSAMFKNKKEKDWLKTLLRERIVEITFVKADGSDRVMKATLLEEKIPSEKLPKGNTKSQNDEVLPVFDVENDGWRSFRWDSIKQINFTL
jgi:hypothetical protein